MFGCGVGTVKFEGDQTTKHSVAAHAIRPSPTAALSSIPFGSFRTPVGEMRLRRSEYSFDGCWLIQSTTKSVPLNPPSNLIPLLAIRMGIRSRDAPAASNLPARIAISKESNGCSLQ